jgi:CG-1 domain
MLLYSRKKVRYRRDGYCWKKRKDGKTTREDHMKLKVQGMEVSASTKMPLLGNHQYYCSALQEHSNSLTD